MQKIVLLGAGNVATHLFTGIQNSTHHKIIQVYNRSAANLEAFKDHTATTTSLNELKYADIYMVSVSDDAVAELIKRIGNHDALIAHTTGSSFTKFCKKKRCLLPLTNILKIHPGRFFGDTYLYRSQ